MKSIQIKFPISTNPTVGMLPIGTCFRRYEKSEKNKTRAKFLYMKVKICPQIRWEYKDGKFYDSTIVNLSTGTVFGIDGNEEVIPLYDAATIDDASKWKDLYVKE